MEVIVKTSELEILFEALLEKLKDLQVHETQIEMDLFQTITSGEFDITTKAEISIGFFVDDWESLQKIIQEDEIVTFLDFDRTASILKAISETIIPTNKSEE